MRVVLDYRPALRERTGIGEYVHELAGALLATQPEGDALTLFTSSWKDRPDPVALAALARARVVDRRWPVRALGWSWHRLGWPPIEVLCGEVDVAHSPTPLLLPARRAARLLTIFDVYFLDHPDRADAHARRVLVPRVRAHAAVADQIVAGSRYAADLVMRRLGVPAGRVTVAPPGVPAWTAAVAATRTPGTGDCLLFVGTLEPRKNVEGLLDAYARLVARHPGAPPLVLAGRATPWAAPLLARVAGGPLASRVQVAGYVSDEARRGLFARARALVLPSWDEGFGLPALEAMACGVPVVASDRGALPEVVGDAGLLAPPDAPEALAAALADTLDDGTAAAMSRRGLDRSATFSWRASAEATRDAYAAAVRRRAERG